MCWKAKAIVCFLNDKYINKFFYHLKMQELKRVVRILRADLDVLIKKNLSLDLKKTNVSDFKSQQHSALAKSIITNIIGRYRWLSSFHMPLYEAGSSCRHASSMIRSALQTTAIFCPALTLRACVDK